MPRVPPIFLQQQPVPDPQQPGEGRPQGAPGGGDGKDAPAFELHPLDPPTIVYGYRIEYAPVVAIPVFLGALALLSLLVERIASFLIRRVAARTATRVDDVFVESLPGLVRAQLTFIALHVVADALVVREDASQKVEQVLTALNYVVVGIVLTRLGLRMTDAWVESKPHLKPVGPGVKFAIKVLVIPILLVLVLQAFGQKVEAFLTVLGVGSLAVALALQDVLKNIFAGLQIVLDQPIRAGDFISLDDGKVKGTVLEIGLRSTKLRTGENNVVIIPNANLATAVVTNAELVDRAYAHTLTLGVAYDSDTRRAQAVLEEELRRAVAEVPGFVNEPPQVFFRDFGDSALVFVVTVKVRQYTDRLHALGELNHRLHGRLAAEGIEIPYPSRTVYLRGTLAAPPPADQRGGP